MKIENYYLNLKKIELLPPEDKKILHEYYRDMLYTNSDGRTSISDSIFLTLLNNGYLIDIREEKINNLINEDNGISP